MKKKFISLLLVLCMVLTFIPATAGAAELIKLDTPTELEWGRNYSWNMNSSASYAEVPGYISWYAGGKSQNWYEMRIYNSEDSSEVASTRWDLGSDRELSYESFPLFLMMDELSSGTYYFTVQSLGDGTTYADSEIAKSAEWTYVKPESALKTVTSSGWDWPSATWKPTDQVSNIDSYEIRYLFSNTADGTPRECGGTIGLNAGITAAEIYDYPIEENGRGYYYYQVRVLSNDITKHQNSAWSQLSEAYHLTDAPVKDSLKDILADEAADIRQEVQGMDTQALKDALLAEQDGSVSDLLADLEEKVGGAAAVETKDGFDKMDTSKVSIVGANLNTSGENKATLNIGNAEKEHVIDEQYQNAVAFSMKLDGVDNTEDLAVPVKITMPIPASINPDFLVILHYHNDGTIEYYEMPYVFQGNDGQWYVSIVVTSFSDFIMAQQATGDHDLSYSPYTTGDERVAIVRETCSHCDHTADATLTAQNGIYTGKALENAAVSYSDGWQGGEAAIAYANNLNAGTATASITVDGVTASVPFTIAKAETHTITLGNLNQTVGSVTPVTWAIDPADTTAKVCVEYGTNVAASPCTHVHDETCTNIYSTGDEDIIDVYSAGGESDLDIYSTGGETCIHVHDDTCGYAEAGTVWSTELPTAAGSYAVSVYLTGSENIVIAQEPQKFEGTLTISNRSYGGSYVPSTPSKEEDKKEEEKPAVKTYGDVAENAWYAGSVQYVTEKGLMNGTSETEFAPNATVTRNMVMTVLARLAGIDTDGGATWFEKAMQWAKENGVSDGTNPTGTITREQLVTMLYRYMKTPEVKGDLSKYTDAADVSDYAVKAMAWAVENGIVNGMTETTLAPKGETTRAQLAAILMRFCELSK